MRRVLSLACGYYPPPCRGSPHMQNVINMVLEDPLPGLGLRQILVMAQDLGAKELVGHLLERMWYKHLDKR